MFQTATTLEFRKVVRKYLKKKGLTNYGSYTNGAPTRHQGFKLGRTVGFCIPNATPAMAAKIEKKLNKKGLTAKTRHTNSGERFPSGCSYGGGYNYIRGTCVLPD